MNLRQELLTVIEQLPDSQVVAVLEFAQSLKTEQVLDRRAFLKLPPEEQDRLLAQQLDPNTPEAQALIAYFQPGSEGMEWVEDYIEDDNWDDEF